MNFFLIRSKLLLTFYIFKLVFLFSPFSTHIRCKILFNQCLIFARKNCKQYLCIHTYKCNIYIYIYIYIYKYIYIIYIYYICMWIFFLLFSFPLSDSHISGRALLSVWLFYFLFYYCVNQLYRKTNSKKLIISIS